MDTPGRGERGFTLIELSIVLVVIGLIVGGVLVGQDLIRAAGERAQITQIEKFNSATNTFFGKYGYLPGDMPGAVATQFGFYVGANCSPTNYGSRNGDGLLQRLSLPYSSPNDYEPAVFWEDLSSKTLHLIEGRYGAFPYNPDCNGYGGFGSISVVGYNLPPAKIGGANYVSVYSLNGANWFVISAPNASTGSVLAYPGLTVKQAYDIDAKIDDGQPTSGNVIATYANWSNGTSTTNAPNGIVDNATTCYNSATNSYSIQVSNGTNINCALSLKMQAGD